MMSCNYNFAVGGDGDDRDRPSRPDMNRPSDWQPPYYGNLIFFIRAIKHFHKLSFNLT